MSFVGQENQLPGKEIQPIKLLKDNKEYEENITDVMLDTFSKGPPPVKIILPAGEAARDIVQNKTQNLKISNGNIQTFFKVKLFSRN